MTRDIPHEPEHKITSSSFHSFSPSFSPSLPLSLLPSSFFSFFPLHHVYSPSLIVPTLPVFFDYFFPVSHHLYLSLSITFPSSHPLPFQTIPTLHFIPLFPSPHTTIPQPLTSSNSPPHQPSLNELPRITHLRYIPVPNDAERSLITCPGAHLRQCAGNHSCLSTP